MASDEQCEISPAGQGKWWPGAELNCRHCDFQSHALPTELPGRGRADYRELPGDCKKTPIEANGTCLSALAREYGAWAMKCVTRSPHAALRLRSGQAQRNAGENAHAAAPIPGFRCASSGLVCFSSHPKGAGVEGRSGLSAVVAGKLTQACPPPVFPNIQ